MTTSIREPAAKSGKDSVGAATAWTQCFLMAPDKPTDLVQMQILLLPAAGPVLMKNHWSCFPELQSPSLFWPPAREAVRTLPGAGAPGMGSQWAPCLAQHPGWGTFSLPQLCSESSTTSVLYLCVNWDLMNCQGCNESNCKLRDNF